MRTALSTNSLRSTFPGTEQTRLDRLRCPVLTTEVATRSELAHWRWDRGALQSGPGREFYGSMACRALLFLEAMEIDFNCANFSNLLYSRVVRVCQCFASSLFYAEAVVSCTRLRSSLCFLNRRALSAAEMTDHSIVFHVHPN